MLRRVCGRWAQHAPVCFGSVRCNRTSTSPNQSVVLEAPLSITNSPFQLHTLTIRLPTLLEKVDARIPQGRARDKLQDLASSLRQGPSIVESTVASITPQMDVSVHPSEELGCPASVQHMSQWHDFMSQQGLNYRTNLFEWRPAIVAEMFFYHRIVDAAGYFHWPSQSSERDASDPFLPQKREAMTQSLQGPTASLAQYVLNEAVSQIEMNPLLMISLWGNKADLTLINESSSESEKEKSSEPSEDPVSYVQQMMRDQKRYLLQDHSPRIVEHLQALSKGPKGLRRIDIVLDNGGLELLSDLIMCTGLLRQHEDLVIHLHAKWHPTFVSDATRADIEDAVVQLQSRSDSGSPYYLLGNILRDFMKEQRLVVEDHPAWTAPVLFNRLPTDLMVSLDASDLVIFKGDANYRRLVLDTKWDLARTFAEVTSYLPFPRAAFRTCKSEICFDVPPEHMDKAVKEDPHFKENGNWGVIQFAR